MLTLIRNICRVVVFGPRKPRRTTREYRALKAAKTAQLRREVVEQALVKAVREAVL